MSQVEINSRLYIKIVECENNISIIKEEKDINIFIHFAKGFRECDIK